MLMTMPSAGVTNANNGRNCVFALLLPPSTPTPRPVLTSAATTRIQQILVQLILSPSTYTHWLNVAQALPKPLHSLPFFATYLHVYVCMYLCICAFWIVCLVVLSLHLVFLSPSYRFYYLIPILWNRNCRDDSRELCALSDSSYQRDHTNDIHTCTYICPLIATSVGVCTCRDKCVWIPCSTTYFRPSRSAVIIASGVM